MIHGKRMQSAFRGTCTLSEVSRTRSAVIVVFLFFVAVVFFVVFWGGSLFFFFFFFSVPVFM